MNQRHENGVNHVVDAGVRMAVYRILALVLSRAVAA
jgi:hypothetical protein